ncbi:MAG TPA: hypothetical protein VLB83_02495 [Candidatus Paceibacterota bacterium]|nr:hypothetical protein [Candidatus Paceibacterota bacterium]
MPSMSGHAHELADCVSGGAIGCAHLADPHAPAGGHGDMYLSLTETPLQSGILLLVLLAVGFAILRINGAQLVRISAHDVMRTAHLRAPRAYTRRDLFARLALFETSPNLS